MRPSGWVIDLLCCACEGEGSVITAQLGSVWSRQGKPFTTVLLCPDWGIPLAKKTKSVLVPVQGVFQPPSKLPWLTELSVGD